MVNVGALKTTISLDSAQFQQGMSGVNRQLKSLKQEQKAVTSSGTGFARGLTEMKGKADVLSRTFELQQAKVKELNRQYEESKNDTGEHSKATQEAAEAHQRAVAEMNKTENQLKNLNAEIARQESPWTKLSEKMTSTGETLQDVGRKTADFGKNWSMRVTAPIVGMGALMLKTGMDFEQSMSNVQAVSGATGGELAALEAAARDMGSQTSKSASDAADGLYYMALAGWDTEEMLGGLEPILRLSEAGAIDLGRASDLVTDSMSALQIEVKDLPAYLDNVAEASRRSNTDIDALMEAYLVAGGNMAQFNVPLEESTALLGLLANRGLKGSEAGRALNAIMVNLTSGAGRAGKAMEDLGLSAFDSEGNFIGLEETLRLVKDRTKDMTDEQQAQYISMIAGKEHLKSFQGLLSGLDDEYGDLKDSVSDADGALMDMATTMQDNAAGNVTRLKSAFEELSIQFAAHILPMFTAGVEKAQDLVQWFSELDDSTKKNIVTMAGLAAAIGPTAIVAGNMTTALGGLLKMGGGVAGMLGKKSGAGAGGAGLIGGFGTLAAGSGPLIGATLAIGGLTAAGIALYNHMQQEMIPEVDLFGDTVSESTQQAVGSYVDLNNKATAQLSELTVTGKELTGDMAESLTETFDQMGATIVEGLEGHKEEGISALEELFAESETLSAENQVTLLEGVKTSYDERIQATEDGTERMNEIINLAAEENRSLTEAENKELATLQEERLNNAIEVLSENEQEQQTIMERMADQAEEISKRQAADMIKNSIEAKDRTVEEAEEQFYSQKLILEEARKELPPEQQKMVDELIKEAERQKDETIKNAEDMHQSVLDEAERQHPNILNEVSMLTGDVLTEWESLTINATKEFAKMIPAASTVWDGVKREFIKKITIPAPTFASVGSLYSKASAIWGAINRTFQRKITVPAPSMNQGRSTSVTNNRSANSARFAGSNADGTNYFNHPSGLSWLGEEGAELVRHNNKWALADFGLYNVPRGAEIFTHDESKKIVRALNNIEIPGYVGGVSPPGEVDRVVNGLNGGGSPLQSKPVEIVLQVGNMKLARAIIEDINRLQGQHVVNNAVFN